MQGITWNTKIVLRGDSRALWEQENPVLLAGEPGVETDTGHFKLGDGVTAWRQLDYAGTNARLGEGVPGDAQAASPGSLWLDMLGGGVYLRTGGPTGCWQRLVLAPELGAFGGGDMHASLFATGDKAALGYVDRAETADRLTTPLTTADIAEADALYFTEQRASQAFEACFSGKRVAQLLDGPDVLTAAEVYVFSGGNA